jgi:hypothetical protein
MAIRSTLTVTACAKVMAAGFMAQAMSDLVPLLEIRRRRPHRRVAHGSAVAGIRFEVVERHRRTFRRCSTQL